MLNNKDVEDYKQWMISKGKARNELTNVYVIDNDEVKIEKKMACVVDVTEKNWKEFCNDTEREFEFVRLNAVDASQVSNLDDWFYMDMLLKNVCASEDFK